MKTITIILNIYLWYICVREVYYLEKEMSEWKYVDWSKLHSLQHIAIWIGAVLLTWFILVSFENYLVSLLFWLYLSLIVIPHIIDERTWDSLNNYRRDNKHC
jgi:hypothetical protein